MDINFINLMTSFGIVDEHQSKFLETTKKIRRELYDLSSLLFPFLRWLGIKIEYQP
jgi:hypothetical protein